MSDYDKMSVEELIGVAADYRGMAVTMDRFIIPALRRAVIREASVAECNLDVAQGYPYVYVRGSIDTFHSLKNGEYHLVPKETP